MFSFYCTFPSLYKICSDRCISIIDLFVNLVIPLSLYLIYIIDNFKLSPSKLLKAGLVFSLFFSTETKYSYSHENNKTDFRLPIHFISRNKEPSSLFPIITLTELTCFILKLILPCHNSTKNNTTRHCVRFTYYFRVTCSKAKKTIFMYRS